MLFEEYLGNLPLLHTWDDGATWTTGGFGHGTLRSLHRFLQRNLPPNPVLLETGAGNSTITMLFLNPARLLSIAPHAKLLPRLAEANRTADPILDFALIDGCHGWPTAFVDLEYANIMLHKGGYLLIDDVQLHSEKEIARLLSEHPAFSIALDLGKIARISQDDRR